MADGIKTFPLRGGVNTVLHKTQLPPGRFSVLSNFRPRHPGFEKRKGQIRHHTIADGVLETMTLFSFSKGEVSEQRLFRQLSDGSVQEATDLPPAITTGAFGAEVLPAVAGALPGVWGVLGDKALFSDGVRQHNLLLGDNAPVKALIVRKSSAPLVRMPTIGIDYTNEATDNLSTTEVVFDGLTRYNDAIYVFSYIPINQINWTVGTPNTNVTWIDVWYWNGTDYVAATGRFDGTSVANIPFAQSGALSWTAPTDELPNYQYGRSGFWYRLTVASLASLSATVRISRVTCSATWQAVRNVWDGVMNPAIEVQIHNLVQDRYLVYGSTAINLSDFPLGNYCYFSSYRPLFGFYVDAGASPNIIKATVTGTDISFHAGGTGESYIKRSASDFLSAGFEPGMSVTISGTVSNNKTATILIVSSSTLYFETGTLIDEGAGANATITFGPNTTAITAVETWTGVGWTAPTGLDDTTAGLTTSGFVTWDRNSVAPEKTQFNESLYHSYWYRFKLDKKLSSNVSVGIETLPYYDMKGFGNGLCNAAWKDRMVYSFDSYPQYVYITATDSPMVLNGSDYAILEVGDGRSNRIRAMKKFHNELLVWQEEKGEEGGCTTLLEGYSPETFGKLVLSNRIGILNSKCAVVIDGVMTATKTEEMLKTLAFWLSRYGVAMSDGRVVSSVSDEIQNYFDPTKSECIRKGYEEKMWLGYDSAENVLRMGLVTGTAIKPNIFPVYDLIEKTWSFDTPGQSLSCMTEAETGSGTASTIQMGGGTSDGYVYQLNQTQNDVNTSVNAELVMEINGHGGRLRLREEVLQVAAQESGEVTQEIALNGSVVFGNGKTLSMTPVNAGDIYRRHRFNKVVDGHHISLKLKHEGSGENAYLLDLGLRLEEIDNNV